MFTPYSEATPILKATPMKEKGLGYQNVEGLCVAVNCDLVAYDVVVGRGSLGSPDKQKVRSRHLVQVVLFASLVGGDSWK